MRCAECGALATEFTLVCVECSAPPVGWRSAADPAAGRPGGNRMAALAVAVAGAMKKVSAAVRVFRWPPAGARRVRRYLVISLVIFLVSYLAGVAVLNNTSQHSGLHHAMDPVILVGVSGVLLSFLLFEAFQFEFRLRQYLWAMVLIVSFGWLAFVPFLWLAIVRRRVRDWAAAAAYLAAALVWLFLVGHNAGSVNDAQVPYEENAWVVFVGLLLIAPIHAVLAFSPLAAPTTFREARKARDADWYRKFRADQVALEDAQPDAGAAA